MCVMRWLKLAERVNLASAQKSSQERQRNRLETLVPVPRPAAAPPIGAQRLAMPRLDADLESLAGHPAPKVIARQPFPSSGVFRRGYGVSIDPLSTPGVDGSRRDRKFRHAAAGFERMGASAPNNVGASDSVAGWSPTIWGLDTC